MPGSSRFLHSRILVAALTALAGCLLTSQGAAAAVTRIGGPGVGPGTFLVPGGDAVDSAGNLYVTDGNRGTVQKFTNTGGFVASSASANAIAFSGTRGIAIDAADHVFVTDPGNLRLVELNTSLGYVSTFATGVASVAVAAGDGFVYTLDVTGGKYRLIQYDGTSAAQTGSKTFPVGNGSGELAAPNPNGAIHDHVAADASGTVYVTDTDNQRVIELDTSLNVLTPALTGFTGYAQAIAVGQVGAATQVYVGDDPAAGTTRIRRFSPSGAQLGSLVVGGAHGGLATDTAGNVFDSDGVSGGAVLRIDTTPDPAIAAMPASGLTSQSVTFDGSGSRTDLWSVADYHWDLDASGAFATGTATVPTIGRQFNVPGTYPIGLQVTATNARSARTTLNYVVGDSSAAFTAPGATVTGTTVTFDATPSVIPYADVTDFAWDFDGSGGFGVDGGTSPTITHEFVASGTYEVQLRVTRAGGRVDTAGATIIVRPRPPAGPVGISIDGGDYATNNPHAVVTLVWPSGAGRVMLSNDGGFGPAGETTTRDVAGQVPWTLKHTGPERLPKTVYARFLDAGIDTQNFTDDVILDETPPTLETAALTSGAGAAAASAARPKSRTYRIKIKAADKIVGVCAVAVSARRSGGTVAAVGNCHRKGVLRLTRTVTVKATSRPRYARVRNSAGSWSRWLRVR